MRPNLRFWCDGSFCPITRAAGAAVVAEIDGRYLMEDFVTVTVNGSQQAERAAVERAMELVSTLDIEDRLRSAVITDCTPVIHHWYLVDAYRRRPCPLLYAPLGQRGNAYNLAHHLSRYAAGIRRDRPHWSDFLVAWVPETTH